jgi:hypothetical protein
MQCLVQVSHLSHPSKRPFFSRGGRPDLAGDALSNVGAPTLLIVGGNDPEVLRLNRAGIAAQAPAATWRRRAA